MILISRPMDVLYALMKIINKKLLGHITFMYSLELALRSLLGRRQGIQ